MSGLDALKDLFQCQHFIVEYFSNFPNGSYIGLYKEEVNPSCLCNKTASKNTKGDSRWWNR